MIWSKIRKRIIERYDEMNKPVKVENLVWLKKNIKQGETIDWTFVDTVDYDIDSIPRKRELVFDFKAKPKEIVRRCQLLNFKKNI